MSDPRPDDLPKDAESLRLLLRTLDRDGHDARRVVARRGDVSISAAVAGRGPLVILMHGWPELALSWRAQMPAIVRAGFCVAAPDMRGYGLSSQPQEASDYTLDAAADDMAALADQLGHDRWVAIGHDWGAPTAWRCALRFPQRVAAVFGLSVPHLPPPSMPFSTAWDLLWPATFFYMRYFQQIGAPERELEADVAQSLRRVFHALSGDAPADTWMRPRPIDAPLLPGLPEPPDGKLSFMEDDEFRAYVRAFERGGFFGPLSWYRNWESDFMLAQAYGDGVIRQPSAFLCGEKEAVLAMVPDALAAQRTALADQRAEIILPGAGHWIQQEHPAEVTAALLQFLHDVRPHI